MNIRQLINTIRYKLKYGSTVEWYNFWYIILRRHQKVIPQVASIDETIRKIVSERCSVSRFGDGEMLLTCDKKNIGFQKGDPVLAKRLKEVLGSHEERHLVAIPDIFTKLNRYKRKCRRFQRTHLFIYGTWWDKLLIPGRKYENAFLSRPYMDYASKEHCARWFHKLKAIWEGRDIIFIEGAMSRLGVGNDLFGNAKSIHRILCPPQNAFEQYDRILNEALKIEKEVLFLIALGPTATILAYDLHKAGYQAVDIGHVDVEYEWWRMGAQRKVKLKQKYVNEASGGNSVTDAGEEYNRQIITKIN